MIKVMPEKRKPTEAAKPAQTAEQPAPKKTGRPSLYNQQLAAQICTRISNGESLRNICREAGMPHMDTIYVWLGKHPVFADQYARAREEQADTLADEIQALSDEPPPMVLGKFGEVIDTGWLQWQKQRIDSRKWCASKLKPKKYGDRVSLAGDAENPLQTSVQVEASELFTSILQNLELKKQIG
jgi:hypothetical protein